MAEAKILIVEDEGIEALDLEHRLTSMGYAVLDIVATGEEAVSKAEEMRPELILMDIMLQGEIDGVTAADQIRARGDIPVIFLTAYADEKTLARAKVTEPYGYLVKPFQERELHIAIDMALYKHRMARKLKESERFLATTLRSIGDAVIATDDQGRITFMNSVAEELTGWKLAEALQAKAADVFRIINRDSRRPVESPIDKVLREGTIVGLANHTLLMTRDGREIPLDDSGAPIRDDQGKMTGVVLVFRDIIERERVEQERERLIAELARSNRELEQFACIVSHDLQSPLRSVTGFLGLLSRRYQGKLDPEADKFISQAVGGAERMHQLIHDILAFSRVRTHGKPFESVASREPLERALDNLQTEIKDSQAEVTFDNLPIVAGDLNQLVQLFQNLIGNSLKYRKTDVPPLIHIAAEEKGGAWELRVDDNGIGFDPQYADRIFQIFQRLHTHLEYSGTGIGLAICKKIVERHGGHIRVESEPDKGSTFFFTLPKVTETSGGD